MIRTAIFLLSACIAHGAAGTYLSLLPQTNSAVDANFVMLAIPSLTTNDSQLINVSNLFSRVQTPVSLIAGTNLLRFTNECYVTSNQVTNILVVSGAGTASVNGSYTNGGGGTVYSKPSTTHGIFFDGITDWSLTNSAGQSLYTLAAADPTNVWDVGSGAAPAPMVLYGSITNCFTVLASSAGLALPTVSSNFYVSEIGNDTNALRGRVDRPWRNVQPALLAAGAAGGGAVCVGPGRYPPLSGYGDLYYVSNRVQLLGSGRGVTIIGVEGAPEKGIQCGSEVVLKDFTCFAAVKFGATATSTNSLMDGVEAIGLADAVYAADFDRLLTINNSRLVSTFDGLADWEITPGGSNRVIRLINCDILVTNSASAFPLSGITGGDNRIEMFGGSIEVLNGMTYNRCVHYAVETFRTNKTGSLLLSNVRLRHASTNTTGSVMVSNINNLPVFLDNCTREIFVASLFNGSFTNHWWHRDVAIPNGAARTNRLVDTRSLTNALMNASEQGHRITITDDGGTASGTNVFIYPSAGQKINQQSFTNIVTDYGSMTLMIRGTNWVVVSKSP